MTRALLPRLFLHARAPSPTAARALPSPAVSNASLATRHPNPRLGRSAIQSRPPGSIRVSAFRSLRFDGGSRRAAAVAMAASGEGPVVTLYTAGTPNGWKAAVLLEELGLPYKVVPISLSKAEQKEDWYLKINPNGRIPAIVDHKNGDYALFESGALMMYLCDHYGDGSLFPKVEDDKGRYEVIAWLMWQMGGLGPMQGQANHFVRYAPVQIEYGKERYMNETRRLYGVLEKQLEGREWLAAGRYTIADIACFSWVFVHFWAGVDIEEFPNLKAWKERIEVRPAVLRGLDVPEPTKFKEAITNKAVREELINEIQNIITPTSASK